MTLTLRASSSGAAEHCSGSAKLVAANPTENDEKERPYLVDGTNAHAHLAHRLCGLDLPENCPEPPGIPWDWIDELAKQYGIVWMDGEAETECPEMELAGVTLTGHTDWRHTNGRRLIVLDWKWGEGQKWFLPRIVEWTQGLIYALLNHQGEDEVLLLRPRPCDQECDEITLNMKSMETIEVFIEEICTRIAADPDTCTPGPHCERCFGQIHCGEWLDQSNDVLALMVRPRGAVTAEHIAETMTNSQLIRWALARKVVAASVEFADDVLRAAVRSGARLECEDQVLRLEGRTRDYIEDVSKVIDVVGNEATVIKVTTSKTLINEVLKNRGFKPAERNAVLEQLRAAGAITARETAGRLAWRKK